MPKNQNKQKSKASVQSTKLNKMPVPGEFETEFSAEEAAEVFEQQAQITETGKTNQKK